MFEEIWFVFFESQKAESAQGLHQPLRCALPEKIGKLIQAVVRLHDPVVKCNQLIPLIRRERYIRVADQRPQVIEQVAVPHALKINENRPVIFNHDVLGLKIPVDQAWRYLLQAVDQFI